MVNSRFIVAGLVLAQLADAITFTIGVSRFGIGVESNDLAAALYQTSGLGGVLIAKAIVLLTTSALLIATADRAMYRSKRGNTSTDIKGLGHARRP